jgi:hypothetical protein
MLEMEGEETSVSLRMGVVWETIQDAVVESLVSRAAMGKAELGRQLVKPL